VSVQFDFPFHLDPSGHTAGTDPDEHIRDMIEQLLLTHPGERVNRPDFGSGLLELVFAPNSPEVAAALELSVQAALQRWLGDVIDVQELDASSEDSTLRVTIRYLVKRTGAVRVDVFEERTS
jgi:Bacteriophage baseplate protein W